MIDLKDYSEQIGQFVINGLERFTKEHGVPDSIGVYCCPWSGWISLNFNIRKTLQETQNNCPDFEFVEYDLIEFPSWVNEYESDNPQWTDSLYSSHYDVIRSGDEDLNHFFYLFLCKLIMEINHSRPLPSTLLQLLDSACCSKIL